MPNTSATGGYLSPAVASPPLEDAALDAPIQQAVVGITSLPGNMVRPRWQATPPKQPAANVDWCAIGITKVTPDAGPAIVHSGNQPTVDGSDTLIRHEEIEVLSSFYGPNSMRYAATLRDGLLIPQNNEALRNAGLFFIDAGEIRGAPELFNQQWVRRSDLQMRFRRQVNRNYTVLNILSARPVINTDDIGIFGN